MVFPARRGHGGKDQKLPSSMSLDRLPTEGVAHIKVVSSCLKIGIVEMSFPSSKDLD